ncbi:MAG: Bax inhibitor-1/YccA family protein [Bacteroidetes bacterium]|nr:Bax inhibitor-1/YccA family protein [Bacteroidota bacterium]
MSSPVLSEKSFAEWNAGFQGEAMTLKGAINKSLILFLTMLAPAAWIWWYMGDMETAAVSGIMGYFWGSMIIGFILSLIISFKQTLAPYLAPVYAVSQGIFLGLISMVFESFFHGIVFQAVTITLLIFAGMLLAYKTGLLRATPMFKKIMFFAIMGVMLFYLVVNLMLVFGATPFYMGNGWLSIGISALIAGVAAFQLINTFDLIDQGAQMGAPKYMEWYSAFGLLVNIIWLYLEILRLLAKLQSRN